MWGLDFLYSFKAIYILLEKNVFYEKLYKIAFRSTAKNWPTLPGMTGSSEKEVQKRYISMI